MKLRLLFVNFDRTNELELSAYLDIQSFNVLKIHNEGKKVCKIGVYGSFCIQMCPLFIGYDMYKNTYRFSLVA